MYNEINELVFTTDNFVNMLPNVFLKCSNSIHL